MFIYYKSSRPSPAFYKLGENINKYDEKIFLYFILKNVNKKEMILLLIEKADASAAPPLS